MPVPGSSTAEDDGGRVYGEPEAKRIVKILTQISESLETDRVLRMKAILTKIIESVKESSTTTFDENVRNFVHIIKFKAGISVNLKKQAVRGFLMMQKQPHLGDMVSKKINHRIAEEFPSLARMGKIDDETLRVYLKALGSGEEKVRHIRLMVVGMFGVGKSCLTKQICNKSVDDVKSTVGVDVLVNACEVDKDGKWISKQSSEKSKAEFDKRLNRIMSETDVEDHLAESDPVTEPSNVTSSTGRSPENMSTTEDSKTYQNQFEKDVFDIAKEAIERFEEDEQPGISDYVDSIVNFQEGDGEDATEIQDERKTSVSIWDFAGQSVYYSTHHFFLSSRSIYILVLNLNKKLDDKVSEGKSGDEFSQESENTLLEGCMPEGFTCRDAFRFWINSIYTYTKEDIGGNGYQPTIVLVGTHKDKLGGTDQHKEKFKDEYFREALKPFADTPVYDLIHHERFLVSCTKDIPEVFEKLRRTIFDIATQQPFWEELVPAKWIPLERSTEEQKAMDRKYMQLEDLLAADGATEYPLKDTKVIQLFLQFQHFLGNILYYNVERLDQTIILNPQWLIDGFKLFVTHRSCIREREVEKAWTEFQEKAILRPELIDYIIEESVNQTSGNNFKAHKEELIEIMQHLDVMAKPVIPVYSTDDSSRDERDFFIVPCILKKITADESMQLRSYFQPKEEKAKTTPVLCFVFENGFLPPAVFHRLLATCIRRFETATNRNEFLLYNGMGVFKLDGRRTLTLWYAEYVIFMRIALYPSSEPLIADECKAVKEEISQMLRTILLLDKQKKSAHQHATVQHDVELYKDYILCESKLGQSVDILFKDAGKNGLLAVSDLQDNDSLLCECGGTDGHHGITSEVALRYWYLTPDLSSVSDPLEAVEHWFKKVQDAKGTLDGVPEERELAKLAEHFCDKYWELGENLGLTQPRLEIIREKNPYNVQNRIRAVFNDWMKDSQSSPTYCVLRDAIRATLKRK